MDVDTNGKWAIFDNSLIANNIGNVDEVLKNLTRYKISS